MPRTAGVAMARFVGIDDLAARRALRNEFGIEVGGGLGPFAGEAWRIGLMGHSARERSVVTLRGALRLDRRGRPFRGGFVCIRAARRNRLLPRIPGRRRSCLRVGVDYDSDLALAKKVLTEAAAVEDVLDSAVALSVKEALDDAGIEIPFPQRVVHLPAEP